MSYDRVKKVRGSGPFRPADIIVYVLLAAVVAALFAVFVFSAARSPALSYAVDVGDERVLTCSSDLTCTVSAAWTERVELTAGDGTLTARIALPNGGYNVVEFTPTSARVTGADCSLRRDCVHSPAVTTDSGVIICVPHDLRVYGEGRGVDAPTTG